MSEKEIRRIIQEVCSDLDRHARLRALASKGVRKLVLPAVVGAGLALGGCVESRSLYGVPMPDGKVAADAKASKKDGKVGSDLAPVYMAPDKGVAKVDSGPQVDYMAPDKGATKVDTGPMPPYMAPDVGTDKKDKGPDGAGPNPLYMASMPKRGPRQS